jgi:hypothetical protein
MIVTVELDDLICTNTKIKHISIEIYNHDTNHHSSQQNRLNLVLLKHNRSRLLLPY